MDGMVLAYLSTSFLGVLMLLLLLRRARTNRDPLPKADVSVARAASLEVDEKPVVKILYGTQTGTAERFSKQLSAELRRRHEGAVTVQVMNLENYKDHRARLCKEKVVVFLVAT